MNLEKALALFLLVGLVACDGDGETASPNQPGAGGSGASGTGGGGTGGEGVADCPTTVAPEPGTVVTDRGAVRGAKDRATWSFKGIRYAAPPVGDLRWAPPAEAECWDTVDASDYGPACPQLTDGGLGMPFGDEDCLRLNVWAPDPAPAELAPVIVWIHGGGHQTGATGQEELGLHLYDGARLAERTGMVVVTVDYRLGALGWLAHPALAAEDPNDSSGMYGHLDQVAALSWVQRNVAGFGGDPDRVVLAGESAGGVAVCTLVASPLAKGLFSAAVMQSGACTAYTRDRAETHGAAVFDAAGCSGDPDPLSCMRALPAEAVISALPVAEGSPTSYQSVVDGWALPDASLDIVEAGAHNPVPFIIGSNSDETSHSVKFSKDADLDDYEAQVAALVGPAAPKVLAEYPASEFASPWAAFVAVTTDSRFTCNARRAARAALAGGSAGVYRYFFTHGLEKTPGQAEDGAWHGLDVFFLFGWIGGRNYVPSEADKAVSDAMMDAWGRFAATGNPGSDGADWPAYDAALDPYLQLDAPLMSGEGVRTAHCDFWDTLTGAPEL